MRSTADPEATQIEPSQILDAAKWAQEQIGIDKMEYEENRNLARTLREYGKYDEAIEQFKITSTLSKENWLCQYGLADCYATRECYTEAIEILEAAKEGIRKGETGNYEELKEQLADVNNDLASWNRSLGRNDEALAIYQERLQVFPEDYGTTFNLITLLHEQGKHSDLLEFLQSLKKSKESETGIDMLTRNFHEYYDRDIYKSALFASVMGDQEFEIIFDGYNQAVAAAKNIILKERKAGNATQEWSALVCQMELMTHLALLCQEYGVGNTERTSYAIEQLLRILEVNESHNEWVQWKQMTARSQLARLCFERLQESPETFAELLGHLEYAASFRAVDDLASGFYASHPSRLLAQYNLLQGNEEKAKSILRPYIKLNMELLSDDDPLNDWQAYNGLAIHLMAAGREADARAAWSLITPSATEGGETSGNDSQGSFLNFCDGDCEKRWTYADDFYICKVCSYVQFDKGCLDKHQEESSSPKICSKKHGMLHVAAYDSEGHKRVGEGNVKVGEEIMSVDEWLQSIRGYWGLKLE